MLRAILALSDNPRPTGCKKLQAEENTWRIRVGRYRVLYEIQDNVLVVIVIRVAHRKEVYKNL